MMSILGSFVNWVIDSLAEHDVIDLYFIQSDMNPDLDVRDFPQAEQDAIYMGDSAARISMEDSGYDPFRPDTWPDYSGKDVF